MAVSADRGVMPWAGHTPDAKPPDKDNAPNLFAPISTANRITGNSRVRRQHAQSQLIPGSSYDYGRSEYTGVADEPTDILRGEDAFGFQKSVPPTFLRRTMFEPSKAEPSVFGLHGIPTPQMLMGGYSAGDANTPTQTQNAFAAVAEPAGKPDFCAPQPAVNAIPEPFEQPASPQNSFSPWQAPASTLPPDTGFAALRRDNAAAGQAAPAQSYTPKHGGRRPLQADEPPQAPVSCVDPWEVAGWKKPEPSTFDNTAVWRVSDLSMFERNAFEEPLDPFRNPPETLFQTAGAEPYPISGAYRNEDSSPPYYPPSPREGEPYAAYDAQANAPYSPNGYDAQANAPYPSNGYDAQANAPYPSNGYDAQGYPYYPSDSGVPGDAAYAGAPKQSAAYRPALKKPQSGKPKSRVEERVRFSLATFGPWRAALVIGVSLALLFCLIEGVKMVQSLLANERQGGNYLKEYTALTGGDTAQAANGVELLPEGVTYAPTATPLAVQTPTPEPKIDQHDPLIGVVDSGGNQATAFQAALPSATPATRTRQIQYPQNVLLSVSADFTDLRQENPDVAGRLVIDGVLDEVFAQRNNTFYLTHNARGVLSATGAIFVDESCTLKKPPENLLLRGQATTEGKLFAPLLRYQTEGASFLTQHGILVCNTVYEQASYVIFAVIRADSQVNSPSYFNYAGYPTFQSDTQMMRYVEAAQAHSMYHINVGVRPTDRLLTLSTVAEGSDTTSLVILCRMLRTGESGDKIQQD